MAENVSALVSPVAKAPGLHYANPRFPLNVKLPDNLECGTKIYIHGTVIPDATRFTFNLKNAETDANTFFHFNPRFGDKNVVVRNSRLDEAWGDEEREGDLPFTPGEPFLLAVTATVDGYEVEVDGAPFTVFNHREGMPLCDVTHVTMSGDVIVHGLHVPLASLPIPLTLRIPGKACLGDIICIKGQVPDGAEKFAVNLQCGAGDAADIMLHMNPRFGDDILVCNSRCAETWGEEVRSAGLPVAPGAPLNLALATAKDGFKAFVDGKACLDLFPHRLNVGAACTVVVDGDVTVESVELDCPPIRLAHHPDAVNADDFDENSAHEFFPSKPSLLKVPDSFGPGKLVYVTGVIDPEPSRFHVNLQCGEDDSSDIALHINPRWDDDEGTVLVLNSFLGGDWGEEVRSPFALTPGSEFALHVLCGDEGYCVTLDGVEVIQNFPHRMEASGVTHVVTDGCVGVTHTFSS